MADHGEYGNYPPQLTTKKVGSGLLQFLLLHRADLVPRYLTSVYAARPNQAYGPMHAQDATARRPEATQRPQQQHEPINQLNSAACKVMTNQRKKVVLPRRLAKRAVETHQRKSKTPPRMGDRAGRKLRLVPRKRKPIERAVRNEAASENIRQSPIHTPRADFFRFPPPTASNGISCEGPTTLRDSPDLIGLRHQPSEEQDDCEGENPSDDDVDVQALEQLEVRHRRFVNCLEYVCGLDVVASPIRPLGWPNAGFSRGLWIQYDLYYVVAQAMRMFNNDQLLKEKIIRSPHFQDTDRMLMDLRVATPYALRTVFSLTQTPVQWAQVLQHPLLSHPASAVAFHFDSWRDGMLDHTEHMERLFHHLTRDPSNTVPLLHYCAIIATIPEKNNSFRFALGLTVGAVLSIRCVASKSMLDLYARYAFDWIDPKHDRPELVVGMFNCVRDFCPELDVGRNYWSFPPQLSNRNRYWYNHVLRQFLAFPKWDELHHQSVWLDFRERDQTLAWGEMPIAVFFFHTFDLHRAHAIAATAASAPLTLLCGHLDARASDGLPDDPKTQLNKHTSALIVSLVFKNQPPLLPQIPFQGAIYVLPTSDPFAAAFLQLLLLLSEGKHHWQ